MTANINECYIIVFLFIDSSLIILILLDEAAIIFPFCIIRFH